MKKWIVAMSAALILFLFCGCGQQASETAETVQPTVTPAVETAPAGTDDMQQSGKSVQGTVTAVDGDTITIQTMAMGPGGGQMGGQMPKNDSTTTDQTKDEAAAAAATAAPETTDLPQNSNTAQGGPSGQAPGGNGNETPQGQPGDMASGAQGEEVTVTISSDTKITTDDNGTSTDASLEDIAVGSMISVTYGDDGETVTTIVIHPMSAAPAPTEQAEQ